MTSFPQRVWEIVRKIPKGKVISYGQVAVYIGVPRAGRAVGWTLRRSQDKSLPWWRVVNASGRISIKGNWEHEASEQRELLRQEGVEVKEDFTLDINKYRFLPDERTLRSWQLPEAYLQTVWKRRPSLGIK